MVYPVSPLQQITAVSPLAQQPLAPATRIKTLQQHDVFFSDRSWKARLIRFGRAAHSAPLMFTFAPPQEGPLNRLVPHKDRTVVLITRKIQQAPQ